ncbi:DnaJ domain-containing protein [Candidatus Woesearchaeota archaeon]|nr:DnaJ domain-containing protein [Candidatus Woesearchaeota archaeon]
MPKNPFRVLGISPADLKSLKDSQLIDIVKSQYRALSLIYHPDRRGGSKRRFTEINEAHSMLSDPEKLRHFREKYKIPHPIKIRELEADIKRLSSRLGQVSNQFSKYLDEMFSEYDPNRYSIFYRDLLLTIADYITNFNLGNKSLFFNRKQTGRIIFTKMRVNSRGELLEKDGRSKNKTFRKSPGKHLLGTIPDEVLRSKAIYNIIYGRRTTAALRSLPGRDQIQRPSGIVSPETFKQYFLPHLSPYLAERSSLFTAVYSPQGLEIIVEGKISKIEDI